MLEWLRRRGQTKRAVERFWRVILVSALDEELHRTDARFGVDVFWKAFLSNSTGYRMGVPAVPLANLYDCCKSEIERRGGEVVLRARYAASKWKAASSLEFASTKGAKKRPMLICSPCPHRAGAAAAGKREAERPSLANLDKIKVAPITGVHFWFDRPVMTEPFLTLLDTTTQWIFNKTALYADSNAKENSAPAGQYLQLVISASYDLLQEPRQEIIDLCLAEVRQALPAARYAKLVKATVIKEAAATFSPAPGVDRWRPKQQTSVPRLFLAGDWTDTGWPATMEGACAAVTWPPKLCFAPQGRPEDFCNRISIRMDSWPCGWGSKTPRDVADNKQPKRKEPRTGTNIQQLTTKNHEAMLIHGATSSYQPIRRSLLVNSSPAASSVLYMSLWMAMNCS